MSQTWRSHIEGKFWRASTRIKLSHLTLVTFYNKHEVIMFDKHYYTQSDQLTIIKHGANQLICWKGFIWAASILVFSYKSSLFVQYSDTRVVAFVSKSKNNNRGSMATVPAMLKLIRLEHTPTSSWGYVQALVCVCVCVSAFVRFLLSSDLIISTLLWFALI